MKYNGRAYIVNKKIYEHMIRFGECHLILMHVYDAKH
jgi:hypothetical protein